MTPGRAAAIDLGAIGNGTMRVAPFRWGRLEEALDRDAVALLASTSPTRGFRLGERRDGDKPYRLQARVLAERGIPSEGSDGDLDGAWRCFLGSLLDPDYRAAMSRLCRVDLSDCELDVTAWRYDADSWLSPHVDKADKVLTHVIYLNAQWWPDWGGQLRILNSSDMDDIADVVAPMPAISAVVIRSDRSWHAVAPVTGAARSAVRLSVTATFRRPEAFVIGVGPGSDG